MLSAFRISDDGRLTKLGQSVASGGLWPCHSSLLESTTPSRLLTSNYQGSTIASHRILPSGELEGREDTISLVGQGDFGPHPSRQKQQHPHACTFDPTGTLLVVPDLGTDELRVYSIGKDSKLAPREAIKLAPGSGPRHVLFDHRSDSSTVLYVMEELSNSISTLTVDYSPPNPSLSLLQSSVSLLPPAPSSRQSDFSHWHSAELAVTPDHSTLIASNRAEDHDRESLCFQPRTSAHLPHLIALNGTKDGDEDLFAIFDISGDGTLVESSKRLRPSGGRAPRHFSLSSESMRRTGATAEWLAVAHHDSDEVVIFALGEGGDMKEVARMADAGRPGCVMWA